MRFSAKDIVFQEVPGEVALAYTITGCTVGCKGCHSVDSWPADRGERLTRQSFTNELDRYAGLITAVLFLGGEWHQDALIELLDVAISRGLRTCLYTGLDTVPALVQRRLTYLKTGPWRAERGGLASATTNQRFYDLSSGKVLNALFCPDFIDCELVN
ncbi:anaerobic ribonucleoside-triphosphate reductase activating protein [Pseudidiomarina halophila]|uniref:Anaerobic ribonucleoside-triphosphate reductase activating protein n=1 Tax=Pseudidiomarina halophila TaxID=1449799 RepID=A0A432XT03_9GAMM|nr:anaerobic ribonucleoside-triphosphate reductase activating protein [Pseudidiomarina halophila]RUO51858.1 anaerobic ribonucleoside-triphosphate reductase activating protein [Pseudidiomarina halophila]